MDFTKSRIYRKFLELHTRLATTFKRRTGLIGGLNPKILRTFHYISSAEVLRARDANVGILVAAEAGTLLPKFKLTDSQTV
jgi:hypothetical protein